MRTCFLAVLPSAGGLANDQECNNNVILKGNLSSALVWTRGLCKKVLLLCTSFVHCVYKTQTKRRTFFFRFMFDMYGAGGGFVRQRNGRGNDLNQGTGRGILFHD